MWTRPGGNGGKVGGVPVFWGPVHQFIGKGDDGHAEDKSLGQVGLWQGGQTAPQS